MCIDPISGTSIGGLIAIDLAMAIPAQEAVHLFRRRGIAVFTNQGVSTAGSRASCARRTPGPAPRGRRSPAGAARATQRPACPPLPTKARWAGSTSSKPCTTPMGSRTGTWRPSTPSWPPLPTDFPTHLALNDRGVATDGVSWANLVAMVGIVEAVAFCGQRLDHVRMPSVSTTDVPFRIAGPIPLGGPLGWGRKVIETFVSGQDQGAVM